MFYIGIDHLSRKRTLSSSAYKSNSSNIYKSSSSYRIRVLLSRKRGKRRITKVKRVAIPTKQKKQETRMTMAAISIRYIVLLPLQA